MTYRMTCHDMSVPPSRTRNMSFICHSAVYLRVCMTSRFRATCHYLSWHMPYHVLPALLNDKDYMSYMSWLKLLSVGSRGSATERPPPLGCSWLKRQGKRRSWALTFDQSSVVYWPDPQQAQAARALPRPLTGGYSPPVPRVPMTCMTCSPCHMK